jgi:hypothetical protein
MASLAGVLVLLERRPTDDAITSFIDPDHCKNKRDGETGLGAYGHRRLV